MPLVSVGLSETRTEWYRCGFFEKHSTPAFDPKRTLAQMQNRGTSLGDRTTGRPQRLEGGPTQLAIVAATGLSVSRVSQLISAREAKCNGLLPKVVCLHHACALMALAKLRRGMVVVDAVAGVRHAGNGPRLNLHFPRQRTRRRTIGRGEGHPDFNRARRAHLDPVDQPQFIDVHRDLRVEARAQGLDDL